ncbi:hypothetical protein ACTVT6_13535, partial [Staphylococcus aureus]
AGISTLFLLLDIGIGFGPVVLGILISSLGYSAMYWLLAITVVIAGVLYYFEHGLIIAPVKGPSKGNLS